MSKKPEERVKKVLVRNTENINPKLSSEAKVVKCIFSKNVPVEQNFMDPSINSTKSILKQLKKVEEKEYKRCEMEDLNDCHKMEVNKKITAKMNFHIDDQVYKNLVALNISDSEAKSYSKKSLSTPKYVSKITKDVEPNLQDFYRNEIKMDKPILPPSVKVKHKPIIKYNSSDITDKILSWEF